MKTLILLMGPTASGKTGLAIQIAKHKNVKIISVDSAMIYRDMNIGTAKPDSQTLVDFPHALIDICSPEQAYSVNKFLSDVKSCIIDAFNDNQTPLLVGGTAFYFNALQNGLSNLPESTQESRQHFNNLLQEFGSIKLHQDLAKIDKISSQKIHCNDTQRITRALEVFHLSGKSLSELQGNKQDKLNYPLKKIVLMPERATLHLRIEKRFLQMIELKFIEEVVLLKSKYNLTKNMAAMRCVGYRQIWQYLNNEIDKSTMLEKAIIATRQLCKRQSTWFKCENDALLLTNTNLKKVMDYV